MYVGESDPKLFPFLRGSLVIFHVKRNSQHNIFWSAENSILIRKVPLHTVQFCTWCAMSATSVNRPTTFGASVSWHRYITLSWHGFLNTGPFKGELLLYFSNAVKKNRLQNFYVYFQTYRLFFVTKQADLDPCNFCLWVTFKDKFDFNIFLTHDSVLVQIIQKYLQITPYKVRETRCSANDRCSGTHILLREVVKDHKTN